MSYKTYKRVISGSLGAVLATTSVIAPAEAFAEENNNSSSAEESTATPTPTPTPSPTEGSGSNGTSGTAPTTSEDAGTPATPAPTPAPTPTPAVKQEAEFKLVDETGTPITDLTGLEFKMTAPDGSVVDGDLEKNGDVIKFIPKTKVDETTVFNYTIKLPGYADFTGEPITFDELKTTLPVLVLDSRKPAGADITFKYDKTIPLTKADFKFTKKDGQEINLSLVDDEVGHFNLSTLKEGDEVSYVINHEGYKKVKGSFKVATTAMEENITLTKLEEASKDKEINKIYGDTAFNLKDLLEMPNDYDGNLTYTIEEGDSVISLDSNQLATISNAGKAKIRVKAPKTDNFKEVDFVVTVNVAKKNLGKINSSMIDWEKAEKTFDGKDEMKLKGVLNSKAGLKSGDEIKVSATLKTNTSSVGTHESQVKKLDFLGDTSNYTYEVDVDKGPDVTITAKNYKVSLKDISVSYGSQEWKDLVAGKVPENYKLKDILDFQTNFDSEEEKAYFENLDIKDFLEVSVKKDKYMVGEVKDSLTLTIKDVPNGNFKFAADKLTANITIKEDERSSEDLWSHISIDNDSSKNIYQKDGTTFIKPGGYIGLNLQEDSGYNKVNIRTTNLGTNEYSDKISIPETVVSKDVIGKFYLSHTESGTTRTKEYDLPDTFKVDADAPVINFVDGSKIFAAIFNAGTTTFSDADQAVKFSKANSKDGYVMTLSSNDEGSGLKSLKYSLVKITSDEDAKAKIKDAVFADDTTWEDVKNNAIAVKGADEGYYIVIVKAKDNVGNESVYASNGMVFDTTNPVVNIKDLSSTNNYSTKDITYKVSLVDPVTNGVTTGIAKTDVIVKANGQVLQSDKPNTNSFSLTTKDLYGVDSIDTFTKFDLAKVEKEFAGTIDADSNDISLEVIAYDNAGNKVSSNEITGLRIDKSKASVSARYDDSVLNNGKYLAKNRQLTVSITDRNFVENNTTVHLTIDGTTKDYNIQDIRDGKVKGIKLVADKVDSQADRQEKDYTNDRTNTYVFEIGGDEAESHSYKADVSYFKNGESAKAVFENGVNEEFVIDKVVPETRIAFTDGVNFDVPVSTDASSPTYVRKGLSAVLVVTEDNFDPASVNVYVTSKNAKGEDNPAHSTEAVKATKLGKWTSENNVHTFVLDAFEEDSNYSLALEYTDFAGNTQKTATYHFTIDKTAPTGTLNISDGGNATSYNSLSDKASFSHVTKSAVEVGQISDDETSGIASVKYYLYHPSLDAKGSFSLPSVDELRSMEWKDWNGTLSLTEDQQTVVYQRIEDKAGNVTYVNTSGAILIDNTAPTQPQITFNSQASANNVFAGNVSTTIRVEDQVSGGTYSGLNTVTVEVFNGSAVSQTQTFNVGSKEDRVQAFSTDFTIDAGLNNSNSITIRVTSVDWAGNTSSSEQKLSIDTVAPRIEIVWDSNDGRQGRYYNRNRTATIHIYERNFNPNATSINVQGGNAQISGWSVSGDGTDNSVNTATVTFAEDGDYTFTVNSTDLAGNSAQQSHTELFTIDKTVPTINVTWDKQLVNGKYVAGTRTATITVVEHNFNASGFTADIKAALESQGIPAPSVSGWSSNGDTHTATLTFSSDGDYSFNLNFEDLAGNRSNSYSENEFTIDSTNPAIEFDGVVDGSSNKGDVRPSVKFSDRNYDKSGITLRLKGYRHKEVVVTGSYSETAQGGIITLDNFPHDADVDDVYTLTAEAVDKAGNKTTKSITFSINRFGSNYYFSVDSEKYLDKYYHNKEKDIVIHEVNTDSLKNKSVTVIRDGSAIALKDSDFSVKDVSTNGWKEYIYTIKDSVFEKEGRYEITVNSEDQAGNKQSNKIKEKPASFIIDKTNPSSVVTGVENGEIYNAIDREIGISVSDNVLASEVELLVDGKVAKVYSEQEIKESNGNLKYTLKNSKSWQVVQLKTKDAAGNEATSEETKVLITPDVATRTLNSMWMKLTGLGFIVTLISAGILWFFIKKKDKEEQEELENNDERRL